MLQSLKDQEYRAAFVEERLKSSIALQIRALREQRNKMTQTQLGEAIGMAQTWVSKLENPEYGKMTVATLLRLATQAFHTDLEIKFRPFSETIDSLPTQGPDYFSVPSFDEELPTIEMKLDQEARYAALTGKDRVSHVLEVETGAALTSTLQEMIRLSSLDYGGYAEAYAAQRQGPGEFERLITGHPPTITITVQDTVSAKDVVSQATQQPAPEQSRDPYKGLRIVRETPVMASANPEPVKAAAA
jgi:transcriptional regulator with XRE-family HTH domain